MVTARKTKKTKKAVKKTAKKKVAKKKKTTSKKVAKKTSKKAVKTTKTPISDYTKYRWFFTSSGKLVVGGKSAEQNEELVKRFMFPQNGHTDIDSRTSLEEYSSKKKKYVVMHTKTPGSPFSIILSEDYNASDLEETAIFTASFSRGWRERKKATVIDIFLLEQVYKNPGMKVGTFGVVDTIDSKKVPIRLYLSKQKGVLRALPFNSKNSVAILPGKVNKDRFAEQIAVKHEIKIEEVLNALPTGGFQISK